MRILALQLKRIGDVVLTTPALVALRAAFPSAQITLGLTAQCHELFPALPFVDDALVFRTRLQALNRELPVTLAEAEPRASVAKWLDAHHAGQLTKRVLRRLGVRLNQTDAHVLALHRVPLKIQDLPYAVAKTIRDDENSRGQREPGNGEKNLGGLALQVAHGDAEGVRE